jgi:hypothetical protein
MMLQTVVAIVFWGALSAQALSGVAPSPNPMSAFVTRPVADSSEGPQLVSPILSWVLAEKGYFRASATATVAVKNAPASAIPFVSRENSPILETVFALAVCSQEAVQGHIKNLIVPTEDAVGAALCGELFAHPEGVCFLHPLRPNNAVQNWTRLAELHPDPETVSFQMDVSLSSAEIRVPTWREWSVFLAGCGLQELQQVTLAHNAEYDACRRAAIFQHLEDPGDVGNITVRGRNVNCGDRSEPFTWSVEGSVSVTPFQPTGETLMAGFLPLLYGRPALLCAEVALASVFGIHTMHMSKSITTILHRSIMAALFLRAMAGIVEVGAFQSSARGMTYASQREITIPMTRSMQAIRVVCVGFVLWLVCSGWQVVFRRLSETPSRSTLFLIVGAAVLLALPSVLSIDRYPSTPDLGPLWMKQDKQSNELLSWLAALAISGATCTVLGAYTLWYSVTTVTTILSFRFRTLVLRGPSPSVERATDIVQQQLKMVHKTKRELARFAFCWSIIGMLNVMLGEKWVMYWLFPLLDDCNSLGLLCVLAFLFRPRSVDRTTGPDGARIRPTTSGGVTDDTEGLSGEKRLQRLFRIPGLDPGTGVAELSTQTPEQLVMRLFAHDKPKVGIDRTDTVAHAPPGVVLISLPRAGAGEASSACASASSSLEASLGTIRCSMQTVSLGIVSHRANWLADRDAPAVRDTSQPHPRVRMLRALERGAACVLDKSSNSHE